MKFKTYEYINPGIKTGKIVEIDLPDSCCGMVPILDGVNSHGANHIINSCSHHMVSYYNIWDNFGPNGKMKINNINVKSSGHKCKSCNIFNEYAESNQADGSYKCFSCRNY